MASNNTTKLGRRNDGVRDNIVVLLAKSEPGIVSARRGLPAPISGERRGRRIICFKRIITPSPFSVPMPTRSIRGWRAMAARLAEKPSGAR